MRINLQIVLCLSLLLAISRCAIAFDNFDCVGSHPNWKLSLTEHKFTFKQEKNPEIAITPTQPMSAENLPLDHIRVYRSKMEGNDFIIVVQHQSCGDGGNSDAFTYEGIIISTDKVLHGCCSKKLVLTK